MAGVTLPGRLSGATRSTTQMDKARGFVIDARSGRPVVGTTVLAIAELDDGRELAVGMLASDAAGYVSFDLGDILAQGNPVKIRITSASGEAAETTLAGRGADVPFLLRMPAERPTQARDDDCDCSQASSGVQPALHPQRLPAVQRPDLLDYNLSPGSFGSDGPVVLNEGACQVLVSAEAHKFATSTYRFNQVVRRTLDVSNGRKARGEGMREETTGELDPILTSLVMANPTAGTMMTLLPPPPPGVPSSPTGVTIDLDKPLELGQVLSFSQTWSPLTHSLGKIAYSLPLAPCESVNIAVIDWSRSDSAVRSDQARSTENLVHSQRRDRSIDEAVDAALSESQGGWSLQYGLGGATRGSVDASIPIEAVKLDLSAGHGVVGGFGYGTAQSWGERDLTGSSLQDLHDTVVQATSVVRRLNSTVVVQSSQNEQNYVETRTITNHNHCHAMTVQYHEVLQHLQVDTCYEGRRWAVLVPFKLLTFDWQLALRYRTILETVLLDRTLAPCFDAIVRSRYCGDVYGEEETGPKQGGGTNGEHKATPVAPTITRYELVLSTGDRNTWGEIWVHVGLKSGDWKLLHDKPKHQGNDSNELWKNTDFTVDVTQGEAIAIDPTQIERVKVSWMEADGGDAWPFKGIRVRYQTSDKPGFNPEPLIDVDKMPYLVWFDDSWGQVKEWIGQAKTPAAPAGPTEDPNPKTEPEEPKTPAHSKVEDACCEQRLLVHLQANIGYYSRACWLLQDPTERVMMLDALFAGLPGVRNGIDPIPVAVNGNYVAFQLNAVAAPEPAASPDLTPKRSVVSLPTRGLFAETHLSNCNACEVRDVTRFWKWDEAPCPDKAPEIQQITPGPKGQATEVQPPVLPSPVVQVMNAPSAPDPTGLAGALTVLGTPDIFRDMSTKQEVSKLLDGLISGAVTLAQAKEMATKAKAGLSSGGTTGGKASGATRTTPNESNAGDQVDKLNAIKYAHDSGLISDEQQQGAAAAVVGGEPLPSDETGTGGSGQSGTVAGSTPAAAFPLIATFEAASGTSPWKLSRSLVAKRLRELIADPRNIKQAGLNLCGPAIFIRLWAARDPVAFVRFAVELFDQGYSKVGENEVRPDSDSLLGEDYALLWTQHCANVQPPNECLMPPQADWMILGSIRDAENFFFDYEGKPEEDVSAITMPGEVIEWLEAASAWTDVRDETNLFFAKGLDHARSLAPDGATDIAMLVNAAMLPNQDLPFIMKVTPNHYIGLESKLRVNGGMVQFDYWTWGNPIASLSIPTATFEKHYYGAVIARR